MLITILLIHSPRYLGSGPQFSEVNRQWIHLQILILFRDRTLAKTREIPFHFLDIVFCFLYNKIMLLLLWLLKELKTVPQRSGSL